MGEEGMGIRRECWIGVDWYWIGIGLDGLVLDWYWIGIGLDGLVLDWMELDGLDWTGLDGIGIGLDETRE
jgi:hypothetical protein